MNLSQTISLSAETVKTSLESYFPISSESYVEDSPVKVLLTNPEVLLEEGSDQVGIRMEITMETVANTLDLPTPKLPGGDGPPIPSLKNGPGKPPQQLPQKSPEKKTGTVVVFGDMEYKAEEGSFYVYNPKIREMTLVDLPEHLDAPARTATEKLTAQYLSKNAVYTLSDEDTTSRTAKWLIKSLKVKDGKLLIEIGI